MYYNFEYPCVSPTGIVDIFIYIFNYLFMYLSILGPVAFNKCILWAYLYEQDQPGKLTYPRKININLFFVSLSWCSARNYWSECISANQNAPCRTFVQINRTNLANLRSYGKFSSHFTETPPTSR